MSKINSAYLTNFVSSLPLGTTFVAHVTTKSMEPALVVGQTIRVTRVDIHSVRVGNIIAYAKGRRKKIMVHRVVGRARVGTRIAYITKGDGRTKADESHVSADEFIGVVKS